VFSYPALLASGVTTKYVFLNLGHLCGVAIACSLGLQYGIPYLVVALIINAQVLAIPGLMMLRSRIGLDLASYYKPCFVPALAAVCMSVCVWLTMHGLRPDTSVHLRLAAEVAVGASVYLAIMYFFKRSALLEMFQTVRGVIGVAGTSKPGARLTTKVKPAGL
jgi:peptidoglycan biosynthesis protein MviN/MurJ (putative lipid II flippase)